MKTVSLFLLSLFVTYSAFGQESPGNKLSAGLQLSQYQNDFGIGVHVVSPFVVKKRLALKARVNKMFNQHVEYPSYTWVSYSNISLGIVGISGTVAENVRLYGEGGALGILQSSRMSSDGFVLGGYGLFGFEFLTKNAAGYFIEIGGAGIGAKANLLPASPIYSNGLVISAGFRFYLK